MARHDSGTRVTISSQWRLMCASTPAAWITEAIGRTTMAEMSPCAPPESTLEMATSQMGHGAWTRSSISRVNPNSCASGMATAWMPWNMMESPTTPGTRTVANADSAPGMLERADALSDFGEHVEEDEAEEERLHQGADGELHQVLAQDDQVAQDQGTERCPAGGGGRTGRCGRHPT